MDALVEDLCHRLKRREGTSLTAIGDPLWLRLDEPAKTLSLTLRILSVYERKTYLGLNEIGVFLDPRRFIKPPPQLARPKRRDQLKPGRTATDPT